MAKTMGPGEMLRRIVGMKELDREVDPKDRHQPDNPQDRLSTNVAIDQGLCPVQEFPYQPQCGHTDANQGGNGD